MDMQEMFDALVDQYKAKRLAESEQLTLGELVAKLDNVHPCTPVYLDIEGVRHNPDGLASYRGYYSDLALDYIAEDTEHFVMVSQLRDELTEANGETFQGYKGGDFTMSRQTPIWVAHYGESGGVGVVGVDTSNTDFVLLLTDQVDGY